MTVLRPTFCSNITTFYLRPVVVHADLERHGDCKAVLPKILYGRRLLTTKAVIGTSEWGDFLRIYNFLFKPSKLHLKTDTARGAEVGQIYPTVSKLFVLGLFGWFSFMEHQQSSVI